MAKGRKPKPREQNEAAGNPARRPDRGPGPTVLRDSTYVAPAFLSEAGRGVWSEVVPTLEKMGVMSRGDVPIVAMLCETQPLWRRALEDYRDAKSRFIPKAVKTVNVLNPETGKHEAMSVPVGMALMPAAGEFAELSKLMIRMYEQLGMSPSARSRVDALPVGGDAANNGDAGDEFFNVQGVPKALRLAQ